MAYPDKDLAAGGTIEGTYTPVELFAGDADVVTEEETVVLGQNLAKLTVVGKVTATNKLVAWDPAAVDGSQVAYGILTQAANAVAADVNLGVYTGGFFNHAALVWPVGVATFAARKAAFAGKSIHIGQVRL